MATAACKEVLQPSSLFIYYKRKVMTKRKRQQRSEITELENSETS